MRNRDYMPIGKNPQYDPYHQKYDQLRLDSQILNGGGQKMNIHSIVDWNSQTIKREINILCGDQSIKESPELYVGGDGKLKIGSIPSVELQLMTINTEFKAYQTTRMNLGERKLTEWPVDLLNKRLQAEAKLDVLNEELLELQKRLQVFIDKEKAIEDTKVLEYGPTNEIELHGFSSPDALIGQLKTIGGQKVSKLSSGEFMIDDERSPYNGMLVADYQDFINKSFQEALCKRRADQLLKLQEEARAKHSEHIPDSLPANMLRLPRVDKRDLPAWPKGVKNYKELETIDDSAISRKSKQ